MNTSFSYTLLSILGLSFLLYSCSDSKSEDYSAYFGGEIINPKSKWVLFYQGETLLDSMRLDDDNRFFIKFDSLATGLYNFTHEYEYQYVYFDKNDSLMVRVNMNNFDESLVFCGIGDEKNNFLIEMYLKNQEDRNSMFSTFDMEENNFIQKADSSYNEILNFYTTKKNDANWNEDFDVIAKASVDYPYYSKKEFYPVAYKRRQRKDIQVSPDFYNHRTNIDFNNEILADFQPYVQYINITIDNIISSESTSGLSYDSYTMSKKLEIVDTITQNKFLKNKIANTIAFRYLMDKEENASDTDFLEKYYNISTDTEKKDKVKDLAQSIRNITESGRLPNITLIDLEDDKVASDDLFVKKTILYFWSKKNDNHFFAVHRKLDKIIEKHPNIDIIAVNIDDENSDWKDFLKKYKNTPNPKIRHYQALNFEEIKDKWVVTRTTRASIIDKDATIIKGFVNIFDATFDKQL